MNFPNLRHRHLSLRLVGPLIGFAPAWGLLGGCTSSPPIEERTRLATSQDPDVDEQRTSENGRPRRAVSDSTVALLIDGEPIDWSTLRPLLAEAAGGEIVEELALEQALRAELNARGISIGDAQIDAARENWLTLLEESGVNTAAETEIRRRRGLGNARFKSLLWRNAALRALIDPSDIAVTDSEIGLAKQIRTGQKYLVTGVISSNAQDALSIAERARSMPQTPIAGLWHAADSRDLRPFRAAMSPLDPAYPESIRRALSSVPVGQPSSAIAVENGFGVIIVEAVLEPANGPVQPDAALRREITIRKTRIAMERLARQLIDRSKISRLDRSLP